jgi:sterol desaturase/sphingolipid hydroxylase (fatty acid hydroxylase superfamily)
MLKTELYQAVTLVLVVLFFDFLERRRPGFAVSRQRELSLNVLSIIVVIVGGELWKQFLLKGFNALNFGEVLDLVSVRSLPPALKIPLAVVLGDLSLYWVHRAMHRRPLLWRTHAFHHSIPEIWWLSGSRTSLTHLLLFAVPQVLIGYFFLALSPAQAGIAFSFGVVVNLWIHTNIRVDLGPLEWLFITPNYHRIHHGAKGLTHSNLAFVFTVWDRMFGTYLDPRRTGTDFGIFAEPTRKRLVRMVIGI